MKKIFTLIFIFTTLLTYSQEISRSTNSSSGGIIKNDKGYTVSWTIGGQFSQMVKEGHHLTEGFQQGNFKKTSLPEETIEIVENPKTISSKEKYNLSCSVFPNPTKGQLFLNIEADDFQTAEIIVYNKIGKEVIRTQASAKGKIQISGIQDLPAGAYFIQIVPSNQSSQTLKFIKV